MDSTSTDNKIIIKSLISDSDEKVIEAFQQDFIQDKNMSLLKSVLGHQLVSLEKQGKLQNIIQLIKLTNSLQLQVLKKIISKLKTITIKQIQLKTKAFITFLKIANIQNVQSLLTQISNIKVQSQQKFAIFCNYTQLPEQNDPNLLYNQLAKKISIIKQYANYYPKLIEYLFQKPSKLGTYFENLQLLKKKNIMNQLQKIRSQAQSRNLAILRIQIILQFNEKGKFCNQWKQAQFTELQLIGKNLDDVDYSEKIFMHYQWRDDKINTLDPFQIVTIEGLNFEKIPVDYKQNYLKAVFNLIDNQLNPKEIITQEYFEKFYFKVLRESISSIKAMDLVDFNIISSKWTEFIKFASVKQNLVESPSKSDMIFQIISHMRDKQRLKNIQCLFWTALFLKKNFVLVKEEKMKGRVRYILRESFKQTNTMSFLLSIDPQGQNTEFFRLVNITQMTRIQKAINCLCISYTKNKDLQNQFKKNFLEVYQKKKNFQASEKQVMHYWKTRFSITPSFCRVSAQQFMKLYQNDSDHVVIVIELGNYNSKFEQKNFDKIWLTPECFHQLIYGTILVDSEGNTKMTNSAFHKILSRLSQVDYGSKKYIIFENLEVLSDGQLDQLSDYLYDYQNGLLEINKQKISFQPNVKIILRTRSRQIILQWDFCKLVKIYQLQPTRQQKIDQRDYSDKMKLVSIENSLYIMQGTSKIKISEGFRKSIGQQNIKRYLQDSGDLQQEFKKYDFLTTEENKRILFKCQQVVDKNSIFLVIEGPTGVGKTFVPTFYAKLTHGLFDQTHKLLNTKQNFFANICFHKGLSEMQLQGKFVVNKGKVQWEGKTTFVKIVQSGGVLLLSELNTVVKNNQPHLAWWLKKLSETSPNSEGDRIIQLQSVPSLEDNFKTITIKKGTLIVIDINTSDYFGRISIPSCFEPINTIKTVSLLTSQTKQQIVIQETNILIKYIEFYWFKGNINQANLQKPENYKKIFEYLATVFRQVVKSYQSGHFGNLSQQQKNQGLSKKWHFSIREIQRVIQDIKYNLKTKLPTSQTNLNQGQKHIIYNAFYENLALRWKQPNFHKSIQEILIKSIYITQKEKYWFSKKEFLEKNLFKFRRLVLWIMSEHDSPIKQELELMKLDQLKNENIQYYSISYQVGQFQLIGGNYDGFFEGVLSSWLSRNKNAKQYVLLVLQNINNLQTGFVSRLNNFTQNLSEGVLWVNSKQYRMPQKGAILMVTRQQIKWSAAESSRPAFLRIAQTANSVQNQLAQIEGKIKDYLQQGVQYDDQIQNLKNGLINFIRDLWKQIYSLNEKKKIQQVKEFIKKENIIKIWCQRITSIRENEKKFFRNQKQIQEMTKKIEKFEKQNTELKEQEASIQQEDIVQVDKEKEIEKIKIRLENLEKLLKEILKQRSSRKKQQNKLYEEKKTMNLQYQNFKKEIRRKLCPQELLNQINTNYEIEYQEQENQIYLKFCNEKFPTNFDSIPSHNQSPTIAITPLVGKILLKTLNSMKKKKTIYFQGDAGVGKTKLAQYIASILNIPIHIFQMSANIQLNDLVGGLKLTYQENGRRITICRRNKKLLQFMKSGGIFVLDQGAMSQQAKQVLSWFSTIVQNITDTKQIQLWDVPTERPLQKIKIHKDFHLIITGNDPNKTIGRKQLPLEVYQFVQKIEVTETESQVELIKIVQNMMKRIVGRQDKENSKKIASVHYQIYTKLKCLRISKRNIIKTIQLLKQQILLGNINEQKFNESIYLVYFAKLPFIDKQKIRLLIQQFKVEVKNNFKNYLKVGIKANDKKNLYKYIDWMSQNRQPLLISYQQNTKYGMLQTLFKQYPSAIIIKSMTPFTQENLLGGYAPIQGQMRFQLSGIGYYLKQKQDQKSNVEVLIFDSIHLIREGSRTQLNQLMQDGFTFINDKKYFWPNNLKIIFLFPAQKVDSLSQPYISRHQHIRYNLEKKEEIRDSQIIKIMARNIPEFFSKLLKNGKFQILNFFSDQPDKRKALLEYRKKRKSSYLKLNVSDDMDETDWIMQIAQVNNNFDMVLKGLFEGLQSNKDIIEIYGLERNPRLINVIQSFAFLNIQNRGEKINCMIPGLHQFVASKNIKIIINTNERLDKICPQVKEWEIKYYNVLKDTDYQLSTIPTNRVKFNNPIGAASIKKYQKVQEKKQQKDKKMEQQKQQSVQRKKQQNRQPKLQQKRQQQINKGSNSQKYQKIKLKIMSSPFSEYSIDENDRLREMQVFIQPTRYGFFIASDCDDNKFLFQIVYDLSIRKAVILNQRKISAFKHVLDNSYFTQELKGILEKEKCFENLQTLDIQMQKLQIQVLKSMKKRINQSAKLKKLIFSWCQKVKYEQMKQSFQFFNIQSLKHIEILQLNLRKNKWVSKDMFFKNMDGFFSKAKNLKYFLLNLQRCGQIDNKFIRHLATVLSKCYKIKQLTLNFGGCPKVNSHSVDSLLKIVKSLKNLEYLYLNLNNNENITQIKQLVNHLLNSSLKIIYLNFRNCRQLSEESKEILKVYQKKYRLIAENEPFVFQISLNKSLNFREFRQMKDVYIKNCVIDHNDRRIWDDFYLQNNPQGQEQLKKAYKTYFFSSELQLSEKYFIKNKGQCYSSQDILKIPHITIFQQGICSILKKLLTSKLILKVDVENCIQNLIFYQNQKYKTKDPSQWNQNQCIMFFKQFNPQFSIPNNIKWPLSSVITIISKMLLHKIPSQQELLKSLQKSLLIVYQRVNEHLKKRWLKSKYYWIRYVGGRTKGIAYCKSGGNFVLKRYLQGKSTVYSRLWQSQGDQNLDKKMSQDYDQFYKSMSDQQIENILKRNPKLIYCLQNQILRSLVNTNNKVFYEALEKTKDILSKLPEEIQKIVKDRAEVQPK